jgi:hypothetical protein
MKENSAACREVVEELQALKKSHAELSLLYHRDQAHQALAEKELTASETRYRRLFELPKMASSSSTRNRG